MWTVTSSGKTLYENNTNFVDSGFVLRVDLRGFTEELDLPQAPLDTSISGKSKVFIGSATSYEESTTARTWPFLVAVGSR